MARKRKVQIAEDEDEEREVTIKPKNLPDGKWGWFVVFCSFICNMIVDGVQYTFANFLGPIAIGFHTSSTEASVIGSLLSGFYNFSGPVAGALGNKFGFRMVCITGSVTASIGLMISYFATDVGYLCFFYGFLGGLGFGMIYMASVITTSIYFEKYRALAAGISVCGTGVGTFVFAPMGTWLVSEYGWRMALVVEGVIVLICIVCALSFKPIEILTVVPIEVSSVGQSMTSLATQFRRGSMFYNAESRRTLLNEAYPTFKEVLMQQDENADTYTLKDYDRRSTVLTIAPRSLRPSMTTTSLANVRQPPIYSVVTSKEDIMEETELRKFFRIFCFNFWHCRCKKKKQFDLGDRPMYRDDIFYVDTLTDLAHSSVEGLDYKLSVTRVPAPEDVKQDTSQKCCVCHHAFVRTCATMTGVGLLKSKIFVFLCLSSFIYTMGLFVPYIFIRKLALESKVPEETAVWLVSAIGISNTAGRLASGIFKSVVKINAALFVLVCLFISGAFSFVFLFSDHLGIFFCFSCVYGFFTAPFISLRPVIIVEFLGLEKLTNAFGLVLLSQGIASIIGPPIAGALEEKTGRCVYVIYMSGCLMFFSAVALLVPTLLKIRANKGLK